MATKRNCKKCGEWTWTETRICGLCESEPPFDESKLTVDERGELRYHIANMLEEYSKRLDRLEVKLHEDFDPFAEKHFRSETKGFITLMNALDKLIPDTMSDIESDQQEAAADEQVARIHDQYHNW